MMYHSSRKLHSLMNTLPDRFNDTIKLKPILIQVEFLSKLILFDKIEKIKSIAKLLLKLSVGNTGIRGVKIGLR